MESLSLFLKAFNFSPYHYYLVSLHSFVLREISIFWKIVLLHIKIRELKEKRTAFVQRI